MECSDLQSKSTEKHETGGWLQLNVDKKLEKKSAFFMDVMNKRFHHNNLDYLAVPVVMIAQGDPAQPLQKSSGLPLSNRRATGGKFEHSPHFRNMPRCIEKKK